MNKLVILVVFAGVVSATLTTNIHLCSSIPISYKLFNNEYSVETGLKLATNELKDRVLHRYCKNMHILDFTKSTQNLTVILYSQEKYLHPVPSHFFRGERYGEQYLMTNPSIPNDPGVNISLVPEILNMSHEDVLKYRMYSGVFNRRGQLKNFEDINDKRTYIDGVVGGISRHAIKEPIRFTPGWTTKLEDKQIISQTLLPRPNSTLKESQVFIVANWLNVTETEGFHSTVEHEKHYETVTVFYKSPNLESGKFNPGFVRVLVKHYNDTGKALYELARLEPGWYGELDHVTKQTLTYVNPQQGPGNPQVRNVTIYPGRYHVLPENGAYGDYQLTTGSKLLTIYYSENPEDNLDNRREMYHVIEIVQQANQNFNGSHVKLSPGWIGVLNRSSIQTLLPDNRDVVGEKVFETEQQVVVTPGWEPFQDHRGFTALAGDASYNVLDRTDLYPISVHFLSEKL